ncbi:MAG: 4Fe-4S binding protein [Kiritimatiellae bacterium]|nr:4Fe-4S binding protein [Kiritimatiellia bacterium]
MKQRSLQRSINITVRLLLLALAALFALGGPVPFIFARLFPSLSPLTLLSEWIAQRQPAIAAFWAIPPLTFLMLACTRGRFFCRWICPAGTVFYLASPRRLNMRLLHLRINGILFWAILASSALGLPVLLFLEPLPMIQRNLVWLHGPLTLYALIPGVLFPLFILLGLFQPMIWCAHCCPTGYLFDLCRSLSRDITRTVNQERRNFLTGVFLGLPLAALAARWPKRPSIRNIPLLPPGARPSPEFGAVCHRCYACVSACPTGILRVDLHADQPLIEWFQPQMDPAYGGCNVDCHACSQVCPSGAIQSISLHLKQHCRIGLAEVNRETCLAWAGRQECLLCMKACPYSAIETTRLPDGTFCPVVNESLCRGCGYCQNACPVEQHGPAIRISALPTQDFIASNF